MQGGKKLVVNFIRGDNNALETANYDLAMKKVAQISKYLLEKGMIDSVQPIIQLKTYGVGWSKEYKEQTMIKAAEMIVDACSPFNPQKRQDYEHQSNTITFTIAEANRFAGQIGQLNNVFYLSISNIVKARAKENSIWEAPLSATRVLFFDNKHKQPPYNDDSQWQGINKMLPGYWFGFKGLYAVGIYSEMNVFNQAFLQGYFFSNIQCNGTHKPLDLMKTLYFYGTNKDIDQFNENIHQLFYIIEYCRFKIPRILSYKTKNRDQEGGQLVQIFNPFVNLNEVTIARTDIQLIFYDHILQQQIEHNRNFNLKNSVKLFIEYNKDNTLENTYLQNMFRFIFVDKSQNTPQNFLNFWQLPKDMNMQKFVYEKKFQYYMMMYFIRKLCIANYGPIKVPKIVK